MVRLEKKIILIPLKIAMNDVIKKMHEGERAICRSILVISLRDIISTCKNPYSKRCKREAENWLDLKGAGHFSFHHVISYLFGDEVDEEELRLKLLYLLLNKRITGTRNLIKILTDITEKFADDDAEISEEIWDDLTKSITL